MSSAPDNLLQMIMQSLQYVYPLISIGFLIAGILVWRAGLRHAGGFTITGASLVLLCQLWRMLSFQIMNQNGNLEPEDYRQLVMISMVVSFAGHCLIAWGFVVAGTVIFRQRQHGHRDDFEGRGSF